MFDAALLALGNVMFLSGLTITMGLSRTARFFMKKLKEMGLKGPLCFFGGIFLVLIRWPIIGMCLESFGFLNLFGNFFPIALAAMRNMPVVGPLLNLPVIAPLADRLAGSGRQAPRGSSWA